MHIAIICAALYILNKIWKNIDKIERNVTKAVKEANEEVRIHRAQRNAGKS